MNTVIADFNKYSSISFLMSSSASVLAFFSSLLDYLFYSLCQERSFPFLIPSHLSVNPTFNFAFRHNFSIQPSLYPSPSPFTIRTLIFLYYCPSRCSYSILFQFFSFLFITFCLLISYLLALVF